MPVSPKPLNAKTVILLATGLTVLTSLTVYRLGSTPPPGPSGTLHLFSGQTMGTDYRVRLVEGENGEEFSHEATASRIEAELELVNRKMSTFLAESELSLFNTHETTDPFVMSPETIRVFAVAEKVSRETGGAFDITVGPLVNAWGFGPEGRTSVPREADIARLKERTGYAKIQIDEAAGTVRKMHPDMYCDLSAIAKGYAVDRVAQALDALGHADYLVEVGGETRTRGLNEQGVVWTVGIERPVENARIVQRAVPLSGWAMATSGDYRNYYEEDGVRISHTIDPATGHPVTHGLASVSVVHRECVYADAYATAFMVLGPEKGRALAEEMEIAAIFLVRNADGTFDELETSAFSLLFSATARAIAPGN